MDTRPLVLPDFEAFPHAVVLDLDGTLLDPDVTLRPRSRAAVEALLAREVPVIVATARPVRTVRMLVGEPLLERVALVQMNGSAFRHAGACIPRSHRFQQRSCDASPHLPRPTCRRLA